MVAWLHGCMLILVMNHGHSFLTQFPSHGRVHGRFLQRNRIPTMKTSSQHQIRYCGQLWSEKRNHNTAGNEKKDSRNSIKDDKEGTFLPAILKLASQHFASQALYTAVRLQILDILGDNSLTLDEIVVSLGDKTNKDALLRTLRLLTTIDVVMEEVCTDSEKVCFSLTDLGRQFQCREQGSSCIQHWMERPLWNAWLELPDYIVGEGGENGVDSPFGVANGGISSDYWYNEKDHPESLAHANTFVRTIQSQEIAAIVNGMEWSLFQNRRLVDIGGYFGNLAAAVANEESLLDVFCLDLPNVIAKAPENERVTFVSGDVFDPLTIPTCDVILMKHFLDKCMWNDDETIQILQNCYGRLSDDGLLIIAEAVLPSYGDALDDENAMPLYMDALYMLVGREGQRRESEWITLARQSSFKIDCIKRTHVPSCSLILLRKA